MNHRRRAAPLPLRPVPCGQDDPPPRSGAGVLDLDAPGARDLQAGELRVELLAEATLPTRVGSFRIAAFQVEGAPAETLALLHGDPGRSSAPLVRLHSECLTSEALGSLRCDCAEQLDTALGLIAAAGDGALLYLRQEGRGIGIVNKIRAYALQDAGLDTVEANLALGLPADARDYSAAAAVLRFLGAPAVRLLTNNPAKTSGLEQYGIRVLERVPLAIEPHDLNRSYLLTKVERMGHLLQIGAAAAALESAAVVDAVG